MRLTLSSETWPEDDNTGLLDTARPEALDLIRMRDSRPNVTLIHFRHPTVSTHIVRDGLGVGGAEDFQLRFDRNGHHDPFNVVPSPHGLLGIGGIDRDQELIAPFQLLPIPGLEVDADFGLGKCWKGIPNLTRHGVVGRGGRRGTSNQDIFTRIQGICRHVRESLWDVDVQGTLKTILPIVVNFRFHPNPLSGAHHEGCIGPGEKIKQQQRSKNLKK